MESFGTWLMPFAINSAKGTQIQLGMLKTYLGNCQDEEIIELLFGSVSEFARLVEEHCDEFTIGDTRVEYDDKNDIHSFYVVEEEA